MDTRYCAGEVGRLRSKDRPDPSMGGLISSGECKGELIHEVKQGWHEQHAEGGPQGLLKRKADC